MRGGGSAVGCALRIVTRRDRRRALSPIAAGSWGTESTGRSGAERSAGEVVREDGDGRRARAQCGRGSTHDPAGGRDTASARGERQWRSLCRGGGAAAAADLHGVWRRTFVGATHTRLSECDRSTRLTVRQHPARCGFCAGIRVTCRPLSCPPWPGGSSMRRAGSCRCWPTRTAAGSGREPLSADRLPIARRQT